MSKDERILELEQQVEELVDALGVMLPVVESIATIFGTSDLQKDLIMNARRVLDKHLKGRRTL